MASVGTASDTSDSDRNIGPLKNHSSSAKRLASSSEEETTNKHRRNRTPSPAKKSKRESEDGSDSRRSSLRKRRTNFRMPSREEQWSSIPTDSRVTSKLSHLTPRKAINNFTRITHRYNYDYVEVSGEESMEEFIKATDSSESSSGRSTSAKPDRKKQKGHRVHGYRPRIAHQSDDSSDDDHPPSPRHQTEDTAPHASRPPPPTTGPQDSGLHPRKARNVKNRKKSTNGGLCSKTQGKEKPVLSVEEIQPASMKKSRRKLLLESDNEESSQSSSSDDPVQPKSDKKSRKSGVLNSDSDEDTEPYTLPNDESTRDKDGSSTKATKESSKQSNSESKEKEFSDKKGPMDEQTSVLFHQGDDNSLLEVSIQKACSGKTPSKDCEDGKSADDGVITVHGSGSSTCDDSGSSSCDDSGSSSCDDDSDSSGTDGGSTDEGESVGRIQKLAARRKEERDSMFGKLKSARAKKQKKT